MNLELTDTLNPALDSLAALKFVAGALSEIVKVTMRPTGKHSCRLGQTQ